MFALKRSEILACERRPHLSVTNSHAPVMAASRNLCLRLLPRQGYNMSMFKNLMTGVVLAAVAMPAFAAVEWVTDLPAAEARAAAENKALLLDFTGSDWCGWCIRIRKEVFDQPRFEAYIRDKFIPVEIDVPNNPNFDPELRKRNEELCKQYAIEGFPTVMVTDARGTVAGGFVGGIVNPEKVEAILNAGLENARKLDAAQKLSGEEKAKVLAEVYKSLPKDLQGAAAPLLSEINALDPRDTTGMARLAKVRQQKEAFRQGLVSMKDEAELLRYLEECLAEAYPENRPMLLNIKGQMLLRVSQTEADVVTAREVLLEAMANDAVQRAQMEKLLSNPAEVLKRMKAYREQMQK